MTWTLKLTPFLKIVLVKLFKTSSLLKGQLHSVSWRHAGVLEKIWHSQSHHFVCYNIHFPSQVPTKNARTHSLSFGVRNSSQYCLGMEKSICLACRFVTEVIRLLLNPLRTKQDLKQQLPKSARPDKAHEKTMVMGAEQVDFWQLLPKRSSSPPCLNAAERQATHRHRLPGYLLFDCPPLWAGCRLQRLCPSQPLLKTSKQGS